MPAGLETALLYLAPALLLALPLLRGRYVGETRVVALSVSAARKARRQRPATALAARLPRAPRVLAARGGRLLADRLAVRGPPARCAAH